ncbi:uncharacterized protein LOC142556982 isoform X4 [Dermacentor variabilis]|uniref:uncharacterized protein LOC142556982 isoform X4 n=1 Tax=Dermacentor variabilis TaxID=34621 RepID=UPI003F5ADE2B
MRKFNRKVPLPDSVDPLTVHALDVLTIRSLRNPSRGTPQASNQDVAAAGGPQSAGMSQCTSNLVSPRRLHSPPMVSKGKGYQPKGAEAKEK